MMVTAGTKWSVGIGLVALCFVLVSGGAVFLIVDHARGQQFVAEGTRALQNGECATALSKFDAALRTRLRVSQRSYVQASRGYCHNAAGRHADALRDYDEALRLNPKFAWAFEARGLIRHYKGEPEIAFEDYSRAIQLDPNSAESLYRRGLIFLSRQQTDGAIVDFREAIRARPGTHYFHLSLGEAQWQKEDLSAARASFEAASRINPRDPVPYRKRAAVLALQGEERKAAADNARAQFLEKVLDGSMARASASDLSARHTGPPRQAIRTLPSRPTVSSSERSFRARMPPSST